jgi:tRNA-dihydrouridine synthase
MVSATTTGLLTLPLSSGTYQLDSPVVLAPMAGITNAPFRMLCREQGAGLFVSEMVTARALLRAYSRNFAHDRARSWRMATLDSVV